MQIINHFWIIVVTLIVTIGTYVLYRQAYNSNISHGSYDASYN